MILREIVSETAQTWPVNQPTVELDVAFQKSSHASSLKIGDNDVWIRNTWHHIGYLLDSLARKESVVGTNLRFRTADELSVPI